MRQKLKHEIKTRRFIMKLLCNIEKTGWWELKKVQVNEVKFEETVILNFFGISHELLELIVSTISCYRPFNGVMSFWSWIFRGFCDKKQILQDKQCITGYECGSWEVLQFPIGIQIPLINNSGQEWKKNNIYFFSIFLFYVATKLLGHEYSLSFLDPST